jgi:hypothetical protein
MTIPSSDRETTDLPTVIYQLSSSQAVSLNGSQLSPKPGFGPHTPQGIRVDVTVRPGRTPKWSQFISGPRPKLRIRRSRLYIVFSMLPSPELLLSLRARLRDPFKPWEAST